VAATGIETLKKRTPTNFLEMFLINTLIQQEERRQLRRERREADRQLRQERLEAEKLRRYEERIRRKEFLT
jgi:hypothetical protein